MARLIKYPSTCYKCQKLFDPQGMKDHEKPFLTRMSGTWKCQCRECYAKKIEEASKGVTIERIETVGRPLSLKTNKQKGWRK